MTPVDGLATSSSNAGASRNQRLLQLIENGNTAAGVRLMAGKQLAHAITHGLYPLQGSKVEEAATSEHYQLLNRLVKIVLGNKNWDVRVAAASVLASCIRNIWRKNFSTGAPYLEASELERDVNGAMAVEKFDIPGFISSYEPLVASSGAEFELDLSAISVSERLKQQKSQLKKTLDFMEGISDLTSELIEDRDLIEEADNSSGCLPDNSGESVQTSVPLEQRTLSVREQAQLRRKSRAASRQIEAHLNSLVGKKPAAKLDLPSEGDNQWDYLRKDLVMKLVLALRANVLNAAWTVRHGALVALKEIFTTSEEEDKSVSWPLCLLDVLARDALAVLCLDRFSDFVSDQTVAPVRETATQLLFCIYNYYYLECFRKFPLQIWDAVFKLVEKTNPWHVRHGAMLCFKYLCAFKNTRYNDEDDAISERQAKLMNIALQECKEDEEEDDDIRSLSLEIVATLFQRSSSIVAMDLTEIRRMVRNVLAGELEAPFQISAIKLMGMLGPAENEYDILSLARLLSSPQSSIRREAINVLDKIINVNDNNCFSSPSSILTLIRVIFQRIILDDDYGIQSQSTQLATRLACYLITGPSKELLSLYVAGCSIVLTPPKRPWDGRHFIFLEAVQPQLQTTNTPPAHELGFRTADLMVCGDVDVTPTRRMAARVLVILGGFYDVGVKTRMAQALVTGDDPMVQYLGILLFGLPVNKTIIMDTTSPLPEMRIWMAQMTKKITPYSAKLMERYLSLEGAEPMREDIVKYLQYYRRNAESLDELLPVLFSQTTRQLIFPTLRLAYGDVIANFKLQEETLQRTLAYSLLMGQITFSKLQKALEDLTEEEWQDGLLQATLLENCRKEPSNFLEMMVVQLLPLLENATTKDDCKIRILQCIRHLFDECSTVLIELSAPIYFLLPMMQKIADSHPTIRRIASSLFGELVRLCPLRSENTHPSKVSSSYALIQRKKEAKKFLKLFMSDGQSIEGSHRKALQMPKFHIPVPIRAELRPYQQAGVNWLAFLARYGLNGILADDMGLGKTLQAICILASSHHHDLSSTSGENKKTQLPSLIICPSSLTGHWRHEILTYASTLGEPLLYVKTPAVRRAALEKFTDQTQPIDRSSITTSSRPMVVVTSYEIARSDSQYLAAIQWNYIVLDEGHMIKNPKSRLKQAVGALRSKHRLILSGTPIQNNVVELWSLMDWLMPDMLGDEATFMERYGRPIMAVQPSLATTSNNSNGAAGAKEFAEAERRLAALHKQVLPFILRRMKENVLKELPPKIIQDCECDPSPIQQLLCAQMEGTMDEEQMEGELVTGATSTTANNNTFQTLNYLRKVCVHPASVLTADHPLAAQVQQTVKEMGLSSIEDIALSPKLSMLLELLLECGIGSDESSEMDEDNHRVLVFAQHKSTLDLIERLVLRPHLPRARHLRLDGSTPQEERFNIAQTFNSNSSYDLLLLTTSVGGLGLNLTGADTVIFVEHDWNPMKDLQAMDRAHRLGQRRVVTVYRLILRDTLEQRVMGLQRWKRRVAATLVQQQNLTSTIDRRDGEKANSPGEEGNFAKETSTGLLELLAGHSDETAESTTSSVGKKARKDANREEEKVQKWLTQHGALLEETSSSTSGEGNVLKEYAAAFDVQAFLRSVGGQQHAKPTWQSK